MSAPPSESLATSIPCTPPSEMVFEDDAPVLRSAFLATVGDLCAPEELRHIRRSYLQVADVGRPHLPSTMSELKTVLAA